jgi:hypothetical protein
MNWIKRVFKWSIWAEIYTMSRLHIIVDKLAHYVDILNLAIWQKWLKTSLAFYYGLNGEGKRMFDFKYWTQVFRQELGYNDADSYNVTISRKPDAKWRVIGVHHLTPEENQGKHNLFIDVLNKDGQRVYGSQVSWDWEGMRPEETPQPLVIDKPENEIADIAMGRGQKISIWLPDSDEVINLHTGHADELGPNGEVWNSWGHHSFIVVFQEIDGDGPIDPPPVEATYSVIGELQIMVNKEWVSSLRPDDKGNITFMTRVKDDK